MSDKNLGKETTPNKLEKPLEPIDPNKHKAEKLKAGLFLTLVTALGLASGFGFSVSSTKKRETKHLTGDKLNHYYNLHDSGVALARRALGRATLYSVSGFTLFCFTVWKLSGASNFNEFRAKVIL